MSDQLQNLVKKCKITKEISSLALSSPQDANSVQEANEIFKENMKRFKKFAQTIINPITIVALVEEMEVINIKSIEKKGLMEQLVEEQLK